MKKKRENARIRIEPAIEKETGELKLDENGNELYQFFTQPQSSGKKNFWGWKLVTERHIKNVLTEKQFSHWKQGRKDTFIKEFPSNKRQKD